MNKRTPKERRRLEAFIRRKHKLGWTDAEMAAAYDEEVSREWIGEVRRAMGIAHNAYSAHRRERVAAKTREQCERAGLKNLAELRSLAYRDFARKCGWPEDLRPRAVQILNVLYQRGPMTRPEIAAAIGMPWKGSRKSLVSNDPEGSYLAHLLKRGLVIAMKRARRITGKGKGKSLDVYAVPLHLERKAVV